MQKDDFDTIQRTCEFAECYNHVIRRLYDLGSQDGYGCIKCKMTFPDSNSFRTNSKQLIDAFKKDFEGCQKITKSELLQNGYTVKAIKHLIDKRLLVESNEIAAINSNDVYYSINT